MLKGINVLNTYDVVSSEWSNTFFPAIVFGFIAVCLISILIYMLFNSKRINDVFVTSFIVIFFALFSMAVSIHGFTHLPENKYQIRYEVTISDDVNFNEFSSKYQVVKQDGLIYTIIEKTNEG